MTVIDHAGIMEKRRLTTAHGRVEANNAAALYNETQCNVSVHILTMLCLQAGQIQCTCISIPLCLSTQSLAPVEGSACPKCFCMFYFKLKHHGTRLTNKFDSDDCRIPQTSDIVNHGDWAIHEATSQKCLCQVYNTGLPRFLALLFSNVCFVMHRIKFGLVART